MTPLEDFYKDATKQARRLVASRVEHLDVLGVLSPDYPGRDAPDEGVLVDASRPHLSAKARAKRLKKPPDEAALLKPWREVWKVEVLVSLPDPLLKNWHLIVALPPTFPDVLPKIYLPHAESTSAGSIPHLDRNRFLCTFDPNEYAFDINLHPGQLVLAVIERAVNLLQEGLAGRNHHEFGEEVAAYWSQECEDSALSLVTANDQMREIVVVIGCGPQSLFADNARQADNWLASLNRRSGQVLPALYLPLSNFGPPFPATNGELWRHLSSYAPESLQRLQKFLAENPRPTPVLFGLEAPPSGQNSGTRVLGAWWHPLFVHETPLGNGRMRRNRGVLPGFSPGIEAVKQEMTRLHCDKKLRRVKISRVDPARLQVRTLGKTVAGFDGTVNVIGCGSVGSLAAQVLARAGAMQSLHGYDPEVLGYENVARHLCPVSRVGMGKAQAVADELGEHFPHIERQHTESDILDVLREKPLALQGSALSLIAIGNLAAEKRLNRLALGDVAGFDHPLCFVWIEPHALGGHALWLPPDGAACFECAFDNMSFKGHFVQSTTPPTRREAGCQTTYVPYGGVDLMAFIAAFGRFLLEAASSSESRLWSWCGDLDVAASAGITMSVDAGQSSFSTRTTPLEPSSACPACKGARQFPKGASQSPFAEQQH